MSGIDIQIAVEDGSEEPPSTSALCKWAQAALSPDNKDAHLCIRIVEEPEIQSLNKIYRDKDKPTNVLSFPSDLPPEIDIPLLGDIVICAAVVTKEATEQDKSATAHWAHMVVHGVLHLQGYDHIEETEAEEMESLETQILRTLGFPNPYALPNEL